MSGSYNGSGSDSDSADEWAEPPKSTTTADAEQDAAAAVAAGPAAGGGVAPPGTRSLEAMDAVERELAGDSVPVVFELPSGETHSAVFFMGQSVEHMKVLLEKEKKLPYEKTTLYLGDRMLFDPLSLSDLPFKAKAENHVKVVMAE